MQEQFDNELKEIEAKQFLTSKDQLGYAEEYITIKSGKHGNNLLLNYSLSNNLEDIKIAIFKRAGLEINIEKAKWHLNPHLSISVKHLMNKHQVLYSMTTFYQKNVRIISINMRTGDYWFYTGYGETDGKCCSWDYYETMEKLQRVLKKIEDRFQFDDDDSNNTD